MPNKPAKEAKNIRVYLEDEPEHETTTSAAEPEIPVQPSWPESTEVRPLRVNLEIADVGKLAMQNAELGMVIDELDALKKASASEYKARIETKEAQRRENDNAIRNGWTEKKVACSWIYECSGFDSATGESIFHPEKKTLVRDDTNEVVEVKDISDTERQLALPLA